MTHSARRLAGSRRNKHFPVARQTLESDTLTERDMVLAARRADFGHTRPDGYNRFAIPSLIVGGRPNHEARAVNIAACFPARRRANTKETA